MIHRMMTQSAHDGVDYEVAKWRLIVDESNLPWRGSLNEAMSRFHINIMTPIENELGDNSPPW